MAFTKHIPNTVTSMNLLAGCMGVVFTFEGKLEAAFIFMLAAAVFDFCDGLAARMLGAYSPIGKELDSLCDVVSFGVLPSLMLLAGMQGWLRFLPLVLAVCSALRLAKFNVDEEQGHDFLGLPTPASAMVAGSLAALAGFVPWIQAQAQWLFPLTALALGLLTVSRVPMFGMKIAPGEKLLDAKRVAFLCLAAAAVLAVVLLRLHWSAAPLLIFLAYIIENLILSLKK